MSDLFDDEETDEVLPDVSGLRPVKSLDALRGAAAPRAPCSPAEALRRGWGYAAFRPLQAEAVQAALDARDCLVVLPTGGGKSVCYQVPAACGRGMTLVVSPLIALMDDQVAAAREAGLRAYALHSNLAAPRRAEAQQALAAGNADLVYVSPERLLLGDLLPALRGLGLIAVDEAHCVSHWGHDFRPEYRQLAGFFAQLGKVPRMALTATATAAVQDDIVVQLGLREPLRLLGHVDRANLIYRCFPRADRKKQVLEVLARHAGEGGIVYAQTRREVDDLCAVLKASGVDAAAYHAGLDARERVRVQDAFVNERLAVVVATVAFGMGIDRSDVRFVVHANCPKSVEHYQQEAGRAGRDGEAAECVLLWSAADFATHRFLARKDGALPPDRARAFERSLKGIARYAVSPLCRHRLLTEHFDQAYPAPGTVQEDGGCGACDVCLGETRELPADQALLTAQKIISCVWRLGGRFGAGTVVDVLLGRDNEKARRHAGLSTFGLLKEAGEPALRAWVDQLVLQEFLAVDEAGDYPLLGMTEAGRDLCKGQGTVRLGAIGPAAKTSRKRKGAAAAAAASAAPGDAGLFERLRAFRRKVAERLGVPPYVVFPDSTLHVIAAAKPADRAALALCKGIGERKLATYGAAVLALVAGGDPEDAAALVG